MSKPQTTQPNQAEEFESSYNLHILEFLDDEILALLDIVEASKHSLKKELVYLIKEAIQTTEEFRNLENPNYVTLEERLNKNIEALKNEPLTEVIS